MEIRSAFSRYQETRDSLFARLDTLKSQVESWLLEWSSSVPTLPAIAKLEGLHGQKLEVLRRLQEADDAFTEHLLKLIQRPD